MAKVILICGKICCGKTTYSEQIRKEENAIILSVDEIMLSIFGQHAGEKHDEYANNTQKYLFDKSIEFVNAGVNVILDWGFWTKENRDKAKEFYKSRGIDMEMHYIDICDETWKQRLAYRNAKVEAGQTAAYFVDENLANKFAAIFETPEKEEIDVWSKV